MSVNSNKTRQWRLRACCRGPRCLALCGCCCCCPSDSSDEVTTVTVNLKQVDQLVTNILWVHCTHSGHCSHTHLLWKWMYRGWCTTAYIMILYRWLLDEHRYFLLFRLPFWYTLCLLMMAYHHPAVISEAPDIHVYVLTFLNYMGLCTSAVSFHRNCVVFACLSCTFVVY